MFLCGPISIFPHNFSYTKFLHILSLAAVLAQQHFYIGSWLPFVSFAEHFISLLKIMSVLILSFSLSVATHLLPTFPCTFLHDSPMFFIHLKTTQYFAVQRHRTLIM